GKRTATEDERAFHNLQEAVLDAFPLDRILTPREVRGQYPTLYEAVMEG
ncbi:unnamed protein product, partial [Laminaria digitata]